jgi:hypothetical protein
MKKAIKYLTTLEVAPEYEPLVRELTYVFKDVWGTFLRLMRLRGLLKISVLTALILGYQCGGVWLVRIYW